MRLNPSLTLAITAKAKQMAAQGLNVISLAAGEPDTLPPDEVKEAAISAIRNNFNKYTQTSGIDELKEAAANKLRTENKIDCTARNIIVTNGGKQALYNSFFVLSPGEVIVPKPYWLSYPEQLAATGNKTVFCETEKNQIKADLIAEKFTPKTKAVIINSPNNPTGAVVPGAELKRIADLALDKNVFVISDEVYEYFIYDEEHVSMASLGEEIKKKTITINAISKSFGVPGWRIGYAAAEENLVKEMTAFQSHVTSNACSIAQKAAVKALQLGPDRRIIKEYKERRDLMADELNRMGLECKRPQGAFYCWAKINDDSMTFCNRLLEESKLAVIPGEPFGMNDHIRLSYAVPLETIRDAMRRLKGFLENKFLQNKNMGF